MSSSITKLRAMASSFDRRQDGDASILAEVVLEAVDELERLQGEVERQRIAPEGDVVGWRSRALAAEAAARYAAANAQCPECECTCLTKGEGSGG